MTNVYHLPRRKPNAQLELLRAQITVILRDLNKLRVRS